MKKCHGCGEVWEGSTGQPGREETCLKCGVDLHVCLNCKLYEPSSSNQCLSRTTEYVHAKDKRNFCDEFEFIKKKSAEVSISEQARPKQWDDLFKN